MAVIVEITLLTVIVEKTLLAVIVEILWAVIVEKLFVDSHRAQLVLIGPVPADVFIVAGGMAGDGRQGA